MVKHLLTKTMLLLAVLCAGATAAWADTVTFTAGTDQGSNGASGNSDSMTKSGITVSGTSFATTTAQYRVYASSKLTISASVGTITKIVFTSTAKKGSTYGLDNLSATGFSPVSNDYTGTWTGNANSVEFYAEAQVRLTKIEVTFDTGGAVVKLPIATIGDLTPTTIRATTTGKFELGLTIADGVANDEYKVTWSTDDDNVLYVEDGEYLAGDAPGEAVVTVHVEPVDHDKYTAVEKEFNIIISPENEVFYESFNSNNFTGGNDGQWSGTIASGTLSSDNEGWTFENGNGANECAKIGSTKYKGIATTPSLSLSAGVYELNFKAGAWNGSSEQTELILSINGATFSDETESVSMEKGAWSDYSLSFTVTEPVSDVKITFAGKNVSNSRFFLDEVQILNVTPASIEKTVSSAGMATFVPQYNVEVPDGVKAMIVTAINAASVSTEDVEFIPAGTPVVLENEGTYNFPVVDYDEELDETSGNLLRVVTADVPAPEGSYVLYNGVNGAGFYVWTGAALSVGRVYLAPVSGNSRQFLSIGGSEATGIETVNAAAENSNVVYDLQGRRVENAVKGLYIVNGKKVIK